MLTPDKCDHTPKIQLILGRGRNSEILAGIRNNKEKTKNEVFL